MNKKTNEKMNEYRREAIALGIRSPFRQMLYVEQRLKGKTSEQAESSARNPGKLFL